MTHDEDGGTAFPARPTEYYPGGLSVTSHHVLSLRDWFAGQALVGLVTQYGINTPANTIAQLAYLYADDMLAALKRKD